jgi:uncharacterized protein (DUF1800 family)
MQKRAGITLLLILSCPLVFGASSKKAKTAPASTAVPLNDRQRAQQLLNRFTFGPRPGDVDHVMAEGLDQWFEEQLAPEKINDSGAQAKLNGLRTLNMSSHDVVAAFPDNAMIRAVADGKAQLPADPTRRAVYEVQLASFREQQAKKNEGAVAQDATAKAQADQRDIDAAAGTATGLLVLPAPTRFAAIIALPVDQRRDFVRNLRGPQRDQLLAGFSPEQREAFLAMNGPTGVVTNELQQAKVLRAVYTERQLQEVMTDFWMNHFNVFQNKDADQYYLTSYERDVIRPHALGKFRDLLVTTAQSPAMLYYLDNWLSVGPESQVGVQSKGKQGLNENYGRELMELHTLGVDGGYTQKDVTELARVFTGWTIDHPEQGGGFVFDKKKHEPGAKTIMGHTFEDGGEQEGLDALTFLSRQPATAKFVCTKIARRFVADDPPPALVAHMAQTFLETDGDIREVLRTMVKSKEFWSPQYYRAKVKTPFEFIVSSIRATGAQVDSPQAVLGTLNRMQMPLYGWAPPTGYPMVAASWMNSDALVDRLNFAIQLSNGQVGGVKFDAQRTLALSVLGSSQLPSSSDAGLSPGISNALSLLESALVDGDVSQQTRKAIVQEVTNTAAKPGDPTAPLPQMIALILGSPEFQKR